MRPVFSLRVLSLLLVVQGFTLSIPQVRASNDGEEGFEIEADTKLPAWEDDACRESFDVRLWPERVVIWLEQENLRDLIADPTRTEAERLELKRLLAVQRTWRMHR